MWNTCKFWWNKIGDEILPVFAQLLWTLKFIFSYSHGKLFFGVISGSYIFSFTTMEILNPSFMIHWTDIHVEV